MSVKIPTLGLDVKKWKQVAIHAGIVGAAAVIGAVMQHMDSNEFGMYTPLIVAGGSILLKYLQKLVVEPPDDPNKIHALSLEDRQSWKQAAKDD